MSLHYLYTMLLHYTHSSPANADRHSVNRQTRRAVACCRRDEQFPQTRRGRRPRHPMTKGLDPMKREADSLPYKVWIKSGCSFVLSLFSRHSLDLMPALDNGAVRIDSAEGGKRVNRAALTDDSARI